MEKNVVYSICILCDFEYKIGTLIILKTSIPVWLLVLGNANFDLI